jgi:hypothetical protein
LLKIPNSKLKILDSNPVTLIIFSMYQENLYVCIIKIILFCAYMYVFIARDLAVGTVHMYGQYVTSVFMYKYAKRKNSDLM